jgi:hypothetical protein
MIWLVMMKGRFRRAKVAWGFDEFDWKDLRGRKVERGKGKGKRRGKINSIIF